MTVHNTARSETAGLLVQIIETLGLVDHIPDTSGRPPRKRGFKNPATVAILSYRPEDLLGWHWSMLGALQVAKRQLQVQQAAIKALQAELHEQREQAGHDPLTGLYNRRYLEETLEREVARAVRAKQPISIVMLDIDDFKTLNDRYGHQAGDQLLCLLGDVLQARTRRDDIACRFGGDEFVVMLTGTPLEAAAERAEEWRRAIEDGQVLDAEHPLHTTLSAGIAGFPVHGPTGAELLRSADRALYQAKTEGRNRVVVLEGPEPSILPSATSA